MRYNNIIEQINKDLRAYFNNPSNPQTISVEDFTKDGFCKINAKSIRQTLRYLDKNYQLSAIPYVYPVRKEINTNWYFTNIKQDSVNQLSVSANKTTEQKTNRIENKQKCSRSNSDEYYVIGLCNEVLGRKALQQHTFDFLKGDTGRKLPVDAYYEDLNLVIEYCERQHTEHVKLFDNKMTVSGVSRGEQRRMYDERRKEILPKHGIDIVTINFTDFGTSKKLKRNRVKDIEIVKNILKRYI